MYNLEIEQRIIEIFIESDYPLNIEDVAKQVPTQRITAKKHLNRLKKRGLIEEIPKPPMLLFFVKEDKQKLKEFLKKREKREIKRD